MSLVNFSNSSLDKLRALLGSFGNDEILRQAKSNPAYIEARWFQVSDIVEVDDGENDPYNEYKAFEVLPDGSPVSDGIVFDSDATNTYKPEDPIYFDNLRVNNLTFSGDVELGFTYQVEALWREEENEDPVYYIIPKGGGGGASIFRLKSKQANVIGYIDLTETGFDLIDNLDNVLEVDVPVIQRKFSQCEFYENEILYATLDSDGVYDLSPFMSGVGVGNA